MAKDTLLSNVNLFVRQAGLEHDMEYFRKGALVAQDPTNYEAIPELDDEDRAVLHDEASRKWHRPKKLWFTVAVCSIGAAVQGWDQVRV